MAGTTPQNTASAPATSDGPGALLNDATIPVPIVMQDLLGADIDPTER